MTRMMCVAGVVLVLGGCKSDEPVRVAEAQAEPAPAAVAPPASTAAPAPLALPAATLPAPASVEPLAAAVPWIDIELEYTDAPDLQEWAEKAKAICVEWYPKICVELASEGFTPPTRTRMTFDPAMRGVAATSRGRIRASAEYVRRNPNDFGMMVHEMVHVVQSYPGRPKRSPSWVVEGIADYIRFYQFEPGSDRSRINPERASYRDSYRTTAAFFNWVVETKDKDLIQKLNASLRKGECDEEKALEILGGDVDALWRAFLATKRQQ